MVVSGPAALAHSNSAHITAPSGSANNGFVVPLHLSELSSCHLTIAPNFFSLHTHCTITSSTHWYTFLWVSWVYNLLTRRGRSHIVTEVPRLVLHSMGDLVLAEEADATSTRMEVVLPHK